MSANKMSYKELYLKWEMCLEKIEEQEEEIKSLIIQRERDQAALKLISAGLGVLDCMATVAKPSEFETLFKDYAPFNNIMAAYFPKQKKNKKDEVTK